MVKKWAQNHDFCHMIANISQNVGLIDTKFGIIIHGINLLVYIKYRVASFTLKVYKFFFFFTKKLIILLKFMCRRMHDFVHLICPNYSWGSCFFPFWAAAPEGTGGDEVL